MNNKIIFHSNRIYNAFFQQNKPVPSDKKMPEWWKKSERYFINKETGEPFFDFQGDKALTFKACPALLDIFSVGYFLITPCDIEFFNEDGIKKIKLDGNFSDFCAPRIEMPGLEVPKGYLKDHFRWYPNWSPELPEGYSALYINPINRFDLPFISMSGIIDNDKTNTPGFIPFFVREDFEGVIPAGTPYLQIIPFKRENWDSEFKYHDSESIRLRQVKSAEIFRIKGGGGYKKHVWSRKEYK
jgi:hypothetical protein